MENGPGLKMYVLLKMVSSQPASYVSLPEGNYPETKIVLENRSGPQKERIGIPTIYFQRAKLLVLASVSQIHSLKPSSEGSPLKIGRCETILSFLGLAYFTSFVSSMEGMR